MVFDWMLLSGVTAFIAILIVIAGVVRGRRREHPVPHKIKGGLRVYMYVNGMMRRVKAKVDWDSHTIDVHGRKYLFDPAHIIYMPAGIIRKHYRPAILLTPEGHSIPFYSIDHETVVKNDVARKLITMKIYADAAEAYQEMIQKMTDVATRRMMWMAIALAVAQVFIGIVMYIQYQALADQFRAAWEFFSRLAGQPPVPG